MCRAAIHEACKLVKVEMKLCLSDDQLKTISAEAKKRDNGVYVLLKEYGRGVDFKMQKEAKVLVLVNGKFELALSDVQQMAGRGSRAQSTPSASVLVIKHPDATDGESLM